MSLSYKINARRQRLSKILIVLSDYDNDPSEVAIPWKEWTKLGHKITFATPNGKKSVLDQRMISGEGLGPCKFLLKANKRAINCYESLITEKNYSLPIGYDQITPSEYDALYIPGGHAPGVRSFLESEKLKEVILYFFNANRPVAAICHGPLLVARTIDPKTNKSVLFGRKTTALLKNQELTAWALTRSFLGDYYRTYKIPVEDEILSVLEKKGHFLRGPAAIFRDDPKHLGRGFCFQDGNYLSARWPGDLHNMVNSFDNMLKA